MSQVLSNVSTDKESSEDKFYSKSNIEALKKSIKQLKEGKTITKKLEDLEKDYQ